MGEIDSCQPVSGKKGSNCLACNITSRYINGLYKHLFVVMTYLKSSAQIIIKNGASGIIYANVCEF